MVYFKLLLNDKRPKSDNIYPVVVRVTYNRNNTTFTTGIRASTRGILYRLQDTMNVPCPYVFIECKNYTKDIANPELDQIAGRFSPQRGKLGFIVCRHLQDRALFIERCRDTFTDHRGLIILLEDADILQLLANVNENNRNFIEEFLSERVREIIAN